MPYFGPYFGPGGVYAPAPDGPDAAPGSLALAYCTDEDVCKAAPEDFAALAPRAGRLALGLDGVFLPSDRWTLKSASNAFGSQGCAANGVVMLGPAPKAHFGRVAGGAAYAVNAASDGGLQLRQVGRALGFGVPPGPAGGLSGVEFVVPTFASEIDQASREANRQYGIDPDLPGRRPADVKPSSLEDLRQWTVLSVLHWSYTMAAKAEDSDFQRKLASVASKLEKVTSRLSVMWGPTGESKAPTGPGSARVIR